LTWSFLVIIPVFVVMVRCFFASFSELYSVSKKRLGLIGLGALIVSWAIGPIIFAPAVFLILRFRDLLEVIV
jgi:1,4-dihydroxy-2-naphthoate octaprenyltransferase